MKTIPTSEWKETDEIIIFGIKITFLAMFSEMALIIGKNFFQFRKFLQAFYSLHKYLFP